MFVVPVITVCMYMLLPYVCLCMLEVISSFRSLRAGSQAFDLLMLFSCVILHTMWSGKSLQLLCIFTFGYVILLSAIRMTVLRFLLSVCMFVGIVV